MPINKNGINISNYKIFQVSRKALFMKYVSLLTYKIYKIIFKD